MKHFNDHWAFTYVFAALCGLALGTILYPSMQPLILTTLAALGMGR